MEWSDGHESRRDRLFSLESRGFSFGPKGIPIWLADVVRHLKFLDLPAMLHHFSVWCLLPEAFCRKIGSLTRRSAVLERSRRHPQYDENDDQADSNGRIRVEVWEMGNLS